MESQGWWNEEAETELKARIRADVMAAFKRAEALKRCELGDLFTDVYGGEEPWNIVSIQIVAQMIEMTDACVLNRKSKERNSVGCSRNTDRSGNPGEMNCPNTRITVGI